MNTPLDTTLAGLYRELGISSGYLEERCLQIYEEGQDLTWVDGCDGPYQLTQDAAAAWKNMLGSSERDGIDMFLVSGYRSYEYQASLIRAKLAAGDSIEDILKVVAPPGFSQHHTGRAIDLGTPGSEFLEEDFETTDAFEWLRKNANDYGFSMPFTRNNSYGFIYEPWHWYYEGTE